MVAYQKVFETVFDWDKTIICKVVAYGRWSLTRSGRYERVDCTLSWHMLLDQFSYVGNQARYRFIELDMSTELDKTRNWNMLAKQVGQLAPGFWTAPFVAAPFLIYLYAYLQISFRLDYYLVMYLLGYRFCASFSLVVFCLSVTKRSQHKWPKFM